MTIHSGFLDHVLVETKINLKLRRSALLCSELSSRGADRLGEVDPKHATAEAAS